eukprot:jgi/Botrbrau1/13467/Bobra.0082s0067.1
MYPKPAVEVAQVGYDVAKADYGVGHARCDVAQAGSDVAQSGCGRSPVTVQSHSTVYAQIQTWLAQQQQQHARARSGRWQPAVDL